MQVTDSTATEPLPADRRLCREINAEQITLWLRLALRAAGLGLDAQTVEYDPQDTEGGEPTFSVGGEHGMSICYGYPPGRDQSQPGIWTVYRPVHYQATRWQPEDWDICEVCQVEGFPDAVLALVLDITRNAIEQAFTAEAERQMLIDESR